MLINVRESPGPDGTRNYIAVMQDGTLVAAGKGAWDWQTAVSARQTLAHRYKVHEQSIRFKRID